MGLRCVMVCMCVPCPGVLWDSGVLWHSGVLRCPGILQYPGMLQCACVFHAQACYGAQALGTQVSALITGLGLAVSIVQITRPGESEQ